MCCRRRSRGVSAERSVVLAYKYLVVDGNDAKMGDGLADEPRLILFIAFTTYISCCCQIDSYI